MRHLLLLSSSGTSIKNQQWVARPNAAKRQFSDSRFENQPFDQAENILAWFIENIRDAIQEYLAAINESIKGTDVREVEIAI